MKANEMIEVYAICVGDFIQIEREKVTIDYGILLDLEARYQCPHCGDRHVYTIPEDQRDLYADE